MWVSRRIEQFIETLIIRLGAIQESIQQHTAATNAANEASSKQWRQVRRILSVVIKSKNNSDSKRSQEHEQDRNNPEERLIRSQEEVAKWTQRAAIAGMLYGAVAFWQGCLIRDQLRQSIAATQASEKSADAAFKTFYATYDPGGAAERTTRQMAYQSAAQFQAAGAAQSAATTSQEAMIAENRPWLSLKDIACDVCDSIIGGNGPVETALKNLKGTVVVTNLKAAIVNTGKTPAEDVKIDFAIHWGYMVNVPPECKKDPFHSARCWPSQFEIRNFQGDSGGVTNSRFHVTPTNIGLVVPNEAMAPPVVFVRETRQQIVSLPDVTTSPTVYVDGLITYRGGWGVRGKTKFCFFPSLAYGGRKRPETYDYCDTPNSNTMR